MAYVHSAHSYGLSKHDRLFSVYLNLQAAQMEEDLRDQVRELQSKLQEVENRADEFERENKKLLRQVDQLEGKT